MEYLKLHSDAKIANIPHLIKWQKLRSEGEKERDGLVLPLLFHCIRLKNCIQAVNLSLSVCG